MPSHDSTNGRFDGRGSSRRRFAFAAGAIGLSGLAGCQGDTTDGTTTGSGSATGTDGTGGTDGAATRPSDPELTLDSIGVPASDVQWNEFNFSNYKWMVQAHVMDPFAVYDPTDDEFVGLLANEWEVDVENRVVTLDLDDGYHWYDGEEVVKPVTAEDVVRHFRMERLGWDYSKFIGDVRATGDHTVEIGVQKGHENVEFLKWNLLQNVLSHGMPLYDEWLERFEDESADRVRKELAELSIPSEEMVSYGPFGVVSATKSKLKATKNPGHPASDGINFPRMAWKYFGGSHQKMWQALGNGDLDGRVRMNVPSDVERNLPDHVENTTYSSLGGRSLAFRWDDDVLGDPRVRRALAYVIDRPAVAESAGSNTHEPVFNNTGMSPGYNWQYLNEEPFIRYEADERKATELLTQAGFEQDGEEWYTPDGDRFGPDIKTGVSGGPDLLAGQTVASQLSQFGLDTRLKTVEPTTFNSNVWDKGDFRIAMVSWGGDYPQPYAWYNGPFTDDRKRMGIPDAIEMPPVGERNVPGDGGIRVEFESAVDKLTQVNGDTLNEVTSRLAWVYNYYVPQIQLYEERTETWFTNDDWEYPSLDSDVMKRRFYTPFHYVLKTGKFEAKVE